MLGAIQHHPVMPLPPEVVTLEVCQESKVRKSFSMKQGEQMFNNQNN